MTAVTSNPGHLQDGPTAVRPTYRLVQVLRAIAALMVVFHHETILFWDRLGFSIIGGNWVNGGAGVDIFFIISGFVMTVSSAPLVQAKHPARTFLARRLERVLPMYWLLTTLKIALVLAYPSSAINGLGGWKHMLLSYLLLPSSAVEPVLVVGWTLIFELAFYVLFAVALELRVRVEWLLAPVLVGLVAWSHWLPGHGNLGFVVDFYSRGALVLEFLFGVLLARALPWVKRLPFWLAALLAIVPWWPLFTWSQPNFSEWRGLQWGLLALGVVTAAVALETRWGAKAPRWTLVLGDASYSIYLTHGFVLPLFALVLLRTSYTWPGARFVLPAIILVVSVAAGLLMYRLVERPLMEWFKGRRRTAVPAVQ